MTAPLDTTELRQCAADVLEWVDFEPLSKPPYGAIKQLCEAFPALLGAAEDWDRLTAEVARLRTWILKEAERNDTCTFPVLSEVCPGCRCHRAALEEKPTPTEDVAFDVNHWRTKP